MEPQAKKKVRLAEFGLLIVVLIWGINFSVMKSAVADLDALVFNALRFTLSVAFLGLLAWKEERGAPPAEPRPWKAWLAVLVLGVFGHLVYQTAFILGLERTTAGNSSLLLGSAPLWTALVAHLCHWERLRAKAWIGLFVCFAGTVTIALSHPEIDLSNEGFVGDLLTVAAAAAWGTFTAASKPLLRYWTSTGLAFRTMLAALPLLWLVALPRMDWNVVAEIDAAAWAAIVYAGLLSTGVAYALWNYGIMHVGAARTAVVANLMPAVAIAVAVLWHGESVKLAQVAGGALVVLGILWVRRTGAERT